MNNYSPALQQFAADLDEAGWIGPSDHMDLSLLIAVYLDVYLERSPDLDPDLHPGHADTVKELRDFFKEAHASGQPPPPRALALFAHFYPNLWY